MRIQYQHFEGYWDTLRSCFKLLKQSLASIIGYYTIHFEK